MVSLPALTFVVAKMTKQVAVSLCDYWLKSEGNDYNLSTLDQNVKIIHSQTTYPGMIVESIERH
jgi:hypothetical protein